MKKPLLSLMPLMLAVLIAAGCAKPAPKCTSPEDNATHHYLQGMNFLDEGRIDDAGAKFERAVFCEDGYSPAYSGAAIVHAMKTTALKDPAFAKVHSDRAQENLRLARKRADDPEAAFAYQLALMRVNTVLKPKDWIEDVEDARKDALKLKVDENKLIFYDGREAADYFMGLSYLEAREFQKARDSFAAVLNSKKEGRWNAPSDKGWKKTDKIVRALAGITVGDVGKEIALRDAVSRGDMAALLADELKIEKLFAGRIPVRSEVEKMKPDFTPADVADHQFKEEALTAMKWRIRGLEPQFDSAANAYLFRPDEPITRKEFALTVEDILIKLTGNEKMASAFFGHEKSPFPDVPPSSAWYNAIMNVTTRNIMETELSGEFRPEDRVDGAEAILAIRVLRQRMNIY